jgi:hypothetical protein
MSIDEAINHYEEVVEEQEDFDKFQCGYRKPGCEDGVWKHTCRLPSNIPVGSSWGECSEQNCPLFPGCLECASEHRQLAEWLKELKAYRKAKKKIIENMKAWEKIYNEPLEWNVEDINSIKLAFYQDGKADAYTDCIGICEIAFEEVNADEDSD